MTYDKIVSLMNADDNSESCGEQIASELSWIFNQFASYKKLAEEVNEKMNRNGRKRFEACMAMAAILLSYNWAYHDFDDWDERHRDSEKFAYDNRGFFHRKISEFIGNEVVKGLDLGSSKDITFEDTLNVGLLKERMFLLGFVRKFRNTHPTIQQAIFGGYVNGLYAAEFPDAAFAFI